MHSGYTYLPKGLLHTPRLSILVHPCLVQVGNHLKPRPKHLTVHKDEGGLEPEDDHPWYPSHLQLVVFLIRALPKVASFDPRFLSLAIRFFMLQAIKIWGLERLGMRIGMGTLDLYPL